MAVYPTSGGSAGTWGTETRAFHGVTRDLDTGKVLNEALQVDATAPIADAALANKKYVDDSLSTAGFWNNSGTQVFGDPAADAPTSFTDLDLSSVVGSNHALVLLKFIDTEGGNTFRVRQNGDTTDSATTQSSSAGYGAQSGFSGGANLAVYLMCATDGSGIIEIDAFTGSRDTDIFVVGYIK